MSKVYDLSRQHKMTQAICQSEYEIKNDEFRSWYPHEYASFPRGLFSAVLYVMGVAKRWWSNVMIFFF